MYAAKTAQEEHIEAELAVKAFDRNNDALPLEQRIEEAAPQPQPKLPLNARTYHALSKLPSYLGGKFFSEKYRDVSSVDFLESLLRVEEIISEAISQWQKDNQTNGFEDCKHPVGELKNRLAEAKKLYCVESNEENVARLEIERLNGMIHYFKKMAENYAEMECVDLARYSETSFYSCVAKSIEKRLIILTKPKKRHNPKITKKDIKEFRMQGIKQKTSEEKTCIVIASVCLGFIGGCFGAGLAELISKIVSGNFPLPINTKVAPFWFSSSSALLFSIAGAYIGYASQKDYSKWYEKQKTI